jgi:nucleoside-diphosphate-sugar epimerase
MYGVGDMNGLSPRVLCAAVYKHLDEKMKFAWDGKLKTNTVHVRDVAAACWHVCQLGDSAGQLYNLADKSDTNQASIAAALETIFGIKTGFVGTIASTAMKAVGTKRVAADYNEKHADGWQAMCKAAGVNSPLTVYIDAEQLAHNHLACNGSAIEATGFSYSVPTLTAATLREQVDTYIAQGMFPPIG